MYENLWPTEIMISWIKAKINVPLTGCVKITDVEDGPINLPKEIYI